MELGLLHDFLEFFFQQGRKYYFHTKGIMQDQIEPTQGEIEHRNEHPSWTGGALARWGAWEWEARVLGWDSGGTEARDGGTGDVQGPEWGVVGVGAKWGVRAMGPEWGTAGACGPEWGVGW